MASWKRGNAHLVTHKNKNSGSLQRARNRPHHHSLDSRMALPTLRAKRRNGGRSCTHRASAEGPQSGALTVAIDAFLFFFANAYRHSCRFRCSREDPVLVRPITLSVTAQGHPHCKVWTPSSASYLTTNSSGVREILTTSGGVQTETTERGGCCKQGWRSCRRRLLGVARQDQNCIIAVVP